MICHTGCTGTSNYRTAAGSNPPLPIRAFVLVPENEPDDDGRQVHISDHAAANTEIAVEILSSTAGWRTPYTHFSIGRIVVESKRIGPLVALDWKHNGNYEAPCVLYTGAHVKDAALKGSVRVQCEKCLGKQFTPYPGEEQIGLPCGHCQARGWMPPAPYRTQHLPFTHVLPTGSPTMDTQYIITMGAWLDTND